jgi:dihydrofolate reductase
MDIAIIAAMGENRAIGKGGKIPWHLPADFKHFRELTMGHPVLMGRKTFESIGKPLPGRTNIVITRDLAYSAEGISVAHSLDEALQIAESAAVSSALGSAGISDAASDGTATVFVLGGAEIYGMALPKANVLYLTKVHGDFEADTFFPEIPGGWKVVASEPHQKDEKNAYDFDFLTYRR